MRPIKFRVWNSLRKEFWHFDLNTLRASELLDRNWFFLDTPQQYTGLKDKNGKEIYEGDKNQDGGVVIWNHDDASFCWNYKGIEIQPMQEENKWCEIIGNIHEHPNHLQP